MIGVERRARLDGAAAGARRRDGRPGWRAAMVAMKRAGVERRQIDGNPSQQRHGDDAEKGAIRHVRLRFHGMQA